MAHSEWHTSEDTASARRPGRADPQPAPRATATRHPTRGGGARGPAARAGDRPTDPWIRGYRFTLYRLQAMLQAMPRAILQAAVGHATCRNTGLGPCCRPQAMLQATIQDMGHAAGHR